MVILTLFTSTSIIPTLFTNSLVSSFFDSFIVDLDELILAGLILILSFFSTLFLTKRWIISAKEAKLLGKDMNKQEKPSIPRSGGLIVALVICSSLFLYIFFKTFSLLGIPSRNVVEAFAISATVLLAGFIGFVDDILGWKQ